MRTYDDSAANGADNGSSRRPNTSFNYNLSRVVCPSISRGRGPGEGMQRGIMPEVSVQFPGPQAQVCSLKFVDVRRARQKGSHHKRWASQPQQGCHKKYMTTPTLVASKPLWEHIPDSLPGTLPVCGVGAWSRKSGQFRIGPQICRTKGL